MGTGFRKGKNRMADFSVKTKAVRTTVDAEARLRRELEKIQQSIREISGGLVVKTAAAPGIKKSLDSLAGRVEGHRESLGSMINALERAAGLYEETEKNICGHTEGVIRNAKLRESKAGSSPLSGLADLFGKIAGKIGEIVEGLFSPVTTVWNQFFWPGIEGILSGIIGNGNWSDSQPTVTWDSEQVSNFAADLTGVIKGWADNVTTDSSTAADSAHVVADLKEREGTILADIKGEYYCSNKNISYAAGWHGQCTWYAYGRFMEVTGIALKSAMHAKTWLYNNADDSRVKITYGGENIQWPAIAVCVSGGGGYGHVMFVEGVEYNADGTPAYVYLTEANVGGTDGILKRLTYEEFIDKDISGYITAA